MASRTQTSKKQGVKSQAEPKPSFCSRIRHGHKEAKRLLLLKNSRGTNLDMTPLHSPASMVMPTTIWDRLPYDWEIDWPARRKQFHAKASRALDKSLHFTDRAIAHLACDADPERPYVHPLKRASEDEYVQRDLACRLVTLMSRNQNEDIDSYLPLAKSYDKSVTEKRFGNHRASFIVALAFVLFFFDEPRNRIPPGWHHPRSWMTRTATKHNLTYMRLYNHGMPVIPEEDEE